MTPQIKQRIAQIQKGEVPTGYKKTDVGIVPQEWEENKLGWLGKFCGGGTPQTSNKDFWNGEIPWVSSSDIGIRDIFDISYKKFITEEAIQKSATKKCPKNSILVVTRVGVGKVALITREVCTSQDFTNIISAKINKDFLSLFLSRKISLEINKLQGTSIKGITSNELKNYNIYYPKKTNEQNRIAEILLTQDKHIELQGKLIAQKQEQKKYLMQMLLTGKQRLKGFSSEWENVELGNIACIGTGNKNNQDKIEGGLYPFFVRSEQIERINSYSFDGEAILIPGEGGIGKIFHYIKGKFDFHQRVYKISDFQQSSTKFIYYYLMQFFKQHSEASSVKATVDSLRLPTFKKFKMFLPALPEQEAIAEILTVADKEIELLQKQLEHEKQRKKSLMQLLLTGIVRV